LQQNNILLNIASVTQSSNTAAHTLLVSTSLSPIRLCKLQKGCTRLAAASDKAYQLLAFGRWFSPGTPVSSTNKTDYNDIAAILLKSDVKHHKPNQMSITLVYDILSYQTSKYLTKSTYFCIASTFVLLFFV
jgi:hypothetical protein